MTSFGDRLAAAFDAVGQLCVGIDPHASLLADWGLTDDASGLREFGLRVVEASAGHASVVKPQVAFFERHGSAGYAALEEVIATARTAGLLVVADPKRGDIGSTFDAYADAWLTPGRRLEVDAITVSPYLGIGSLTGGWELASAHGKGVFVLAATSNPEATILQTATTSDGTTVARGIVDAVRRWNADAASLGSAGLVIGATVDLADYDIDAASIGSSPVLAPGFGFQGARFDQVGELFGDAARNILVSASRSILSAGPRDIRAAVVEQSAELAGAFAS